MEKCEGKAGQPAEEGSGKEEGSKKMKRYRIREGSFMDWLISITAPIAVILFIGLATGIVDYI